MEVMLFVAGSWQIKLSEVCQWQIAWPQVDHFTLLCENMAKQFLHINIKAITTAHSQMNATVKITMKDEA